ncbi:MAG: MFS transporter [Actinobacteria bacterium]|nr:MFS transporter [Actinomycetota bacterium]
MRRYRELMALTHVKVLVFAALPARIAYGMIQLAIFFKVERETGSIPLAGLAIGLNALASSLSAGIRGTVMDRYGQKWPLRILVPAYAAMLIVLNISHSSFAILIFSFLLGLTAPPINLSVRPLWKTIVPPTLLRTAYALDTSLISAMSVIGPIVATTLALSTHPGAPLVTCAVLLVMGGFSLALTQVSREYVPEKKEANSAPLWRHPALRLLMLEGSFIGFGWGAFNVAVPAFALIEKVPHRTAWVLGILGFSNIIGGLLGGLVSKNSSSLATLRRAYLVWFVLSLPLAFTYPGWSMALVGAFLGIAGGAIQVFYWEVMEAVRPKGSATGALGWLWTIEGSMMALGSAVGGLIAKEISPRVCLAITSICIGLGVVIINLGKARLSEANRIPTDDEDLDAMRDNSAQN